MPQAGREDVTESLIARLRERQAVGIATYRKPLQTFNRRDMGRDADEELLDFWLYLEGLRLEYAALVAAVRAYQDALATFRTPDGLDDIRATRTALFVLVEEAT